MIQKILSLVDRLFVPSTERASLLARNICWFTEDNNWIQRIQANKNIDRLLYHSDVEVE